MGERGSFITEFIYCRQCFEAVEDALITDDKRLQGCVVREGHIIGGYVKHSWPGGGYEPLQMAFDNAKSLPCHDVRIAIHNDDNTTSVYIVNADGFDIYSIGTVKVE